MIKNIDEMTSSEWIAHRLEKVENHYKKGFTLIPDAECKNCDVNNDYVCFECELNQLENV